MSDTTTVEGTGETVGEAKWSALRELERRFPGLDRQAVEFQVLSEGERGLMGIGREPAASSRRSARRRRPSSAPPSPSAVPSRARPASRRGRRGRPGAGAVLGEESSPEAPRGARDRRRHRERQRAHSWLMALL